MFRKADPGSTEAIDASRSGSAGATSDDVNEKDGNVETTRRVASAYGGNDSSRYGRRPTPWPGVHPDPKSVDRLLARHRANATQSSEEGDVIEPLPAPRKYFSRLARRRGTRSVEEDSVAAYLPAPREHLSKSIPRPDAHPDREVVDRLAAPVRSNAAQPPSDADIVPPPLPPRSPLRLTFSRDTIFGRSSEPKKKGRFDSLRPGYGHYVPSGRKVSSDVSDSTERPAEPSSDDSENVSESLSGSVGTTGSNPGHSVLRLLSRHPGKTVKRPSNAGLETNTQVRARDGSRPTTGTDEVNTGKAVHNVLHMFPGDPTRFSARRSITAIPKAPDNLGVLPDAYANDDGDPGPSSRRKSSLPAGIEEEEEQEELDDDARSPTDTRSSAPQLPETFQSSQYDVISHDFALNDLGTRETFDGLQ